MATEQPTASNPSSSALSADEKILADLHTLTEKMDLCSKMLKPADGAPAPSLKNNETLLQVIGFLEACAPRMVELVEAAANSVGSVLSEETMFKCLEVNDKLQKQLADIETTYQTETPATTTAASAAASSSSDNPGTASLEQNFDDLLLSNDSVGNSNNTDPMAVKTAPASLSPAVGGAAVVPTGKSTGEEESNVDLFAGNDLTTTAAAPAAGVKSTGEDDITTDPFAGNDLSSTSTMPAATSDINTTSATTETKKDEFDDFFAERTSSKTG